MDQELWYDSTLGHNHSREFLLDMQSFCLIHRFGAHLSWAGVDFLDGHYVGAYSSQPMMDFESWLSLRGDQTSFFKWEHKTWLTYFIWCTLHKGIFLSRWWFLRHSCSLEVIRFILHWSMRCDWVSWLNVFIREHSLLIGIDKFFFRWLD